jgi:hypothetical protein
VPAKISPFSKAEKPLVIKFDVLTWVYYPHESTRKKGAGKSPFHWLMYVAGNVIYLPPDLSVAVLSQAAYILVLIALKYAPLTVVARRRRKETIDRQPPHTRRDRCA